MTAGAVPFHRRSVISMVLGVLAFCLLFVVPFAALVLSLPSMTTGVHARREIEESAGTVRGHDLAGYGIVVGAVTLVLVFVTFALDAFATR